jgi:hypothetical protein
VFTLRCTKKLLARLGSTPALDLEPTTRLGDWYANLLFRPGGQVVLFVNERSLLPVLVPAAPASSLVTRFQAAAADLLLRLGVPGAAVEAERREMTEARIGKTASRHVLGVMTDFAYLLGAYSRAPLFLGDIAVKLASTPCSPSGWKHPADAAVEMLGAGR